MTTSKTGPSRGITGLRGGTVDDHLAIADLMYRYAAGIDNLDRDAFAACFTPDAVFWGENSDVATFRMTGPEEIAQAVDWHQEYAFTMHNVHNHVYTIDGSTARGRTYCVATTVQGEPGAWTTRDQYIFYDDHLVEEGGRWLIKERRFRLFSMHEVPLEGFPIGAAEHRSGPA